MSLYDKLNDDPRVQNCFPKFITKCFNYFIS